MTRPETPPRIRERLRGLDWRAIEDSLSGQGFARISTLLTAEECQRLIALYPDDGRFRSRVQMERHRFGAGDYAYFSRPLPALVQDLRTHTYRHLVPIANRWSSQVSGCERFPSTLKSFLAHCHAHGQRRPTPLLLRYGSGGYNRLHRDLYGDIAFPLQLTCFLSRPRIDYTGGEFLLVEQVPRTQLRGDAITPRRGDMVIFPAADRPVPGRRGFLRASIRHGVSRVTRGSRFTLGVIFHDAR
jgi:hypothetical protein